MSEKKIYEKAGKLYGKLNEELRRENGSRGRLEFHEVNKAIFQYRYFFRGNQYVRNINLIDLIKKKGRRKFIKRFLYDVDVRSITISF